MARQKKGRRNANFIFQLDIIVPPIKTQEEYAALAKQYLKGKASKKLKWPQ